MVAAQIRVGIIGVHPDKGWAITAHVPALTQLAQYRVAAISHNSLEIARRVAAEHNIEHAFSFAEDLISHRDIDLVVVAVRVTKHRDLVSKAIEAGKAVLCEWPLAVSANEAIEMQKSAAARRVPNFIGLQTRAAPAVEYARDLIQNGYVGEVLSANMIGSGIIWGESIKEGFAYTLDPANGAAMLNVPFAHSLDALLHILASRVKRLTAIHSTRRKSIKIEETDIQVPMGVADQVVLAGELNSGTIIAVHFRGGLSQGTNFQIEINGTRGDLIISSAVGYVGIGGIHIKGSQNGALLHALDIPRSYGGDRFEDGLVQSVALSYERIASDMLTGTKLAPTFEDAVELHRIIQAVHDGKEVVHSHIAPSLIACN